MKYSDKQKQNLNEYAVELIKLVRDMSASENDTTESARVDRLIKFIEDRKLKIED